MRDGGYWSGRGFLGRELWLRRGFVALCLAALAGSEILDHVREARPLGTGPVDIRYAPSADLERFDLALIGQATRSIDMAAYLLTDASLIEALAEAAARGVKVRLYLDGGEEASGPGFGGRARLLRDTQRIEVRLKPEGGEIMHLKSYCVDGKLVRSGSANFTFSGLKREDDDLVVIRDRAAALAFEQQFELMWRRGSNLPEAVGTSRL